MLTPNMQTHYVQENPFPTDKKKATCSNCNREGKAAGDARLVGSRRGDTKRGRTTARLLRASLQRTAGPAAGGGGAGQHSHEGIGDSSMGAAVRRVGPRTGEGVG
jgi:hypothetical protein